MLRDSYVTLRAGKLDRTITLERSGPSFDAPQAIDANGLPIKGWEVEGDGTPSQVWRTLATVKAEMLEMGSTDYMRAQGASFEKLGIFRIRWIDGLTLADRVRYNGTHYRIEDINEIGRRVGLELRCKAVGPS